MVSARAGAVWNERSAAQDCGELYLPFLAANAQAFANGMERLEINVWGLSYALSPFKYQVKCLSLLRDKFAALDVENQTALKPVLERTGCWHT